MFIQTTCRSNKDDVGIFGKGNGGGPGSLPVVLIVGVQRLRLRLCSESLRQVERRGVVGGSSVSLNHSLWYTGPDLGHEEVDLCRASGVRLVGGDRTGRGFREWLEVEHSLKWSLDHQGPGPHSKTSNLHGRHVPHVHGRHL